MNSLPGATNLPVANLPTNTGEQIPSATSAAAKSADETGKELELLRQLAETNRLTILELNHKLAAREACFLMTVGQAPVAICILKGENLVIESANEMMLKIFDRSDSVLDIPLSIAVPDLCCQTFLTLLHDAYTGGKNTYATEIKFKLQVDRQPKIYYFNFINKPILDKSGSVSSIIVVAIDVTEQVYAKNELQKTVGLLNISVEAANIGTWSMDLKSGQVTLSDRHKELLGFAPADLVASDELMDCVPAEQRIEVFKAVAVAIRDGSLFDMTYSTIGLHDNEVRWIRALGNVTLDEAGLPGLFSGISIETTVQKQDEARKNEFINIVSHELKTPLTSLKGYIQLLQLSSEKAENKLMSAMLLKADKRLDKMTSLINGFLNISQLESGKINLNIETFDLNKLILEISDELNLDAQQERILFIPESQAYVKADRDRIAQVISNLLTNAIKYSPPGAEVVISCRSDADLATTFITDKGSGIKKENIPLIFERYYRVPSAKNEFVSGFGIGLYLCREILNRHNTALKVESELGLGSVFSFSLLAGQPFRNGKA